MAALDSVRVVVVGDSGVGKTSLVNLMCQEISKNPSCTIGASVEIYMHEYKAVTPAEKTYFIEFWDIGGSSSHKNSRSIFYNNVHGIILVHDLSNRKSLQNLPKWLAEVLNKDHDTDQRNEYDPEQFAGNQIPVIITGTRADVANKDALLRKSRLAEESGADELFLDCHQVKSLAAGSTNAVKLSKFLDKVIERRYHSGSTSQGLSAPNPTNRRLFSPHPKSSHID